jgi:hypothetical protein
VVENFDRSLKDIYPAQVVFQNRYFFFIFWFLNNVSDRNDIPGTGTGYFVVPIH